MIIATAPPRRSTPRARARAPAASTSATPSPARVDCQKRSSQPTLRRLVTTRSSVSRATAHAARSQLPVCDAAMTAPRPRASASRQRAADVAPSRTCAVAPGPCDARYRSSIAEVPRARYIARACDRGDATPAARIAPSTCARRIRSRLPAMKPRTAPTAGNTRHGSAPTALASARSASGAGVAAAAGTRGRSISRTRRGASPCRRSRPLRGPRRRCPCARR